MGLWWVWKKHRCTSERKRDAEREALAAALHSSDAFVRRRAQILLAGARGEGVGLIAPPVGYSGRAVQQIIHSFHQVGLAVLQRRSSCNHTLYYCFDTAAAQRPRQLLRQSPRTFGKATSL